MLRLQGVLFGESSGPRGKVKATYIPLFIHLAIVLSRGSGSRAGRSGSVPSRRSLGDLMAGERIAFFRDRRGTRTQSMAALRSRFRLRARDRHGARDRRGRSARPLGRQGRRTPRVAVAGFADTASYHCASPTITSRRSATFIRRRSASNAPFVISTASADRDARRAAMARPRSMGGERTTRRARARGFARSGVDHPFLPVHGEGLHQIPVGPGPCRYHRARPFPLHCQWRDRGAARRTARLCVRASTGCSRTSISSGRADRGAHFGRFHRRAELLRFRARSRARSASPCLKAGAGDPRRDGRIGAHRKPFLATSARSATMRHSHSSTPIAASSASILAAADAVAFAHRLMMDEITPAAWRDISAAGVKAISRRLTRSSSRLLKS